MTYWPSEAPHDNPTSDAKGEMPTSGLLRTVIRQQCQLHGLMPHRSQGARTSGGATLHRTGIPQDAKGSPRYASRSPCRGIPRHTNPGYRGDSKLARSVEMATSNKDNAGTPRQERTPGVPGKAARTGARRPAQANHRVPQDSQPAAPRIHRVEVRMQETPASSEAGSAGSCLDARSERRPRGQAGEVAQDGYGDERVGHLWVRGLQGFGRRRRSTRRIRRTRHSRSTCRTGRTTSTSP